MKKVNTGNISIELLVGYIEESLNSSDKAQVMEWIEADPENRKFHDLLEEAWKNPGDIMDLDSEKREFDWKVVSTVMENDLKESGKRNTNFNRWWLRAAGLLLLVSSTTVAYFIGSNKASPLSEVKDHFNEIVVPMGEKSELMLSDGTRIWVNASSSIRFPGQFTAESRDIWLDGEAYFEVAGDRKHPFIVHTSELDVKVLGTKFNLKAYSDEDIIEATVVEGLVRIESHGAFNIRKDEVLLRPNHKAIYLKKKGKVIDKEQIAREIVEPLVPKKIILTKTVKVESAISWHEGKLIFLDESFESIALKLERRYDVKITIETDGIKKLRYTGILKNVSIEQALKALQLTTPFNYSIKDNSIVITEK
jgi:ferric-dicitrate binding protein FerR (iron transport regulator)